MSWTEDRGGREDEKCVSEFVIVCSLQLWNVESARRAQWHVWNQSEKECSGTWRVRKNTEKKGKLDEGEKEGGGGGRVLEREGACKQKIVWRLSQAYPGLCWRVHWEGLCFILRMMSTDWGEDVTTIGLVPNEIVSATQTLVPVTVRWSACQYVF